MGSGATAQRIAYGQALGEAQAIQEHQLAMIPIVQKQAEMELEIKEKSFALEVEQAKQLNLLAQQLHAQEVQQAQQAQQAQQVLVPVQETEGPGSKNLVYIALAILACFLIMKRKR